MVDPAIKFLVPAYLYLLSTDEKFRSNFREKNEVVADLVDKFAEEPIRKGARLPAHAHQLVQYLNHNIKFFTKKSVELGALFSDTVSKLAGGEYEPEFRNIAKSAENKILAENIAAEFFKGNYDSGDPFMAALDMAYQGEIAAAGGASCKGCKLNGIRASFTDKIKRHLIASASVQTS